MDRKTLDRLLDHMEWADALVWRTVHESEAARRDDYVLDSLFHLHLVQHAYLCVWTGAELPELDRAGFETPNEIEHWARPFYGEARELLEGLGEGRLAEEFDNPWGALIEPLIGAPPAPSTLGDTAYQVVAHSAHHRAQINRRLRELGGDPAMIDYIGWVWRGCPPPQWP